MRDWNNKNTTELAKALMALNSTKEAKRFLRDLLTEQEIIEFGNRWKVAQMLDQNIPYTKIERTTGMSSTTIARVSLWLRKGKNGYRLILDRLHSHHQSKSLPGKV